MAEDGFGAAAPSATTPINAWRKAITDEFDD